MRTIKLWHETIFPEGSWRNIANQKEKGNIADELNELKSRSEALDREAEIVKADLRRIFCI